MKHNVGFEEKIIFAVHFQFEPCREFYISILSTFIAAFSLICAKINQLRIGLGSEMINGSFEKHEVDLGVFGYLVGWTIFGFWGRIQGVGLSAAV